MILRNVARIHPSPMNVAIESVRDLMRERLTAPDNADWNEGRVIEIRFRHADGHGGFNSMFTNAPLYTVKQVVQQNMEVMVFIAEHGIEAEIVAQDCSRLGVVKG